MGERGEGEREGGKGGRREKKEGGGGRGRGGLHLYSL